MCFGKQISTVVDARHSDLAQRVAKMRRKFAKQYGFVVPEIKLADDLSVPPKSYQIKIHGTVVASARSSASATCSSSPATGRSPTCPATRRASRRSA